MATNSRTASQALRTIRVTSCRSSSANFRLQKASIRPITVTCSRPYASKAEPDLKATLKEVIPAKRELLKRLKSEHGNTVIGEIKIENAIGGMR
jgi:citrate synthase